jgi:hypothetical protein
MLRLAGAVGRVGLELRQESWLTQRGRAAESGNFGSLNAERLMPLRFPVT